MYKSLSDNLNMLMSQHRLSSNELARKINIPATTIKRIRNNEQANPTLATLLPIAGYFSVSLNQLIGAESLSAAKETMFVVKLHKIPLLSWEKCVEYAVLDYEQVSDYVLTERAVSKKAFCLFVDNNDLSEFPKNSILVVEPEIQPEAGDYVIVANVRHNVVSIRKYIIEIDRIYLGSLLSGAGVLVLTDEYQIIGVIIQYKVELKMESK